MAGANDRSQIAAIDRYASEIGLAFQIVDDILDVEGRHRTTLGKTAGKDAAAGKPTYRALRRRRSKAGRRVPGHANAALERAGLRDSRLADIARWILDRRS